MDKVRVALKTFLFLLALVVTALAAMPDIASSQTNCCVARDCFGGRFACGTCTDSTGFHTCTTSIR
jgi:hypothetical protein